MIKTKKCVRAKRLLVLALLATAVALSAKSASAAVKEPLGSPEQLSLTAATNLSAVAAALELQHKGLIAMVGERTNSVVDLHRLASNSQKEVDSDLIVYDNTRGTVLAAFFTAITKHGDTSAEAPAQLDALEASIRAEVAAGVAVPALMTDKMQAAAKKLAVLAKQQSETDRIKEWVTFYKDTKAATEALQEKANASKEKSDTSSAKEKSAMLSTDTN